MIAQDNPMIDSFVGTVMQLTTDEKVAQACEMRRRYSNDIATYEEEIATKNAEITRKAAEIADKAAEIADKDAEIADKDAEIASLKALLKANNIPMK